MDIRVYQTNLGKIGLYDLPERKIVRESSDSSLSLPYVNGQETLENYAVAVTRPRHLNQIYLPQAEKLFKKSISGNGPYLAYHQAQMLEDQETQHIVDILV